MAPIVLAEGYAPDQETIDRANEEGIPLLMSSQSSYYLSGLAFAAGLVGETS